MLFITSLSLSTVGSYVFGGWEGKVGVSMIPLIRGLPTAYQAIYLEKLWRTIYEKTVHVQHLNFLHVTKYEKERSVVFYVAKAKAMVDSKL